MMKFWIKKSVIYLFSSFIVLTATFCALRAIPGDPFTREMTLPREIVLALRSHYGLDEPLLFQYFSYLQKMATLNFGPSLTYEGRTVGELIQEALPISFLLGLLSGMFSLFFGYTLGLFFAKIPQKSSITRFVNAACLSVPTFVLAPFLQYFFSLKWSIFPIGGCAGIDSLVLPILTLSFIPIFQIAKIVHASTRAILQEDYIKTVRAKGMGEKELWRSHVNKNALIPVLDYLVPLTSYLLMGSFVVEQTFSLPGLGQLMVRSIESRDYGCVMGLVFVYCLVLFSVEWLVSALKPHLDPRMRHEIA
ncbi:MAG: ABC transporter permease [Chlamydiota bacterium]